jgi:hypothetical protein
MPRTSIAIQSLALGLSGIVTLGLMLALDGTAAQHHRHAPWASSGAQTVQQVVIVGQRVPRS